MASFGGLLNGGFINKMLNGILSNEESRDKCLDLDLKDYGNYYLLKGYLKGYSSDDISIDFEKNKVILKIKNVKTYKKTTSFSMVTIVEAGGTIVKDFDVEEIDTKNLSATFNDGVLLITLPKIENNEEILENTENASFAPKIIYAEDYKVE